MEPKKIVILGITGSIGDSTLKIIRSHPNLFTVAGFSYHSNFEKAASIAKEFHVTNAACTDTYHENIQYWKDNKIRFFDSMEDLLYIEYDILITGIVGSIGIRPTLKAIRDNKTILLANKETLVMAGDLVIKELNKSKSKIIPIDSEHSSIFRIISKKEHPAEKIILTASGGALREYSVEQIKGAQIKDVLNHPTWSMGHKITVDSAGMINKALEVIEAHHLFQIPYDKIEAVIHPQSYIHAMVGWLDGSFDFHVSKPSMLYPIAYGLFYPESAPALTPPVLPANFPAFEFHSIHIDKYPGFFLGIEAGKMGSLYSTVFNAANEIAALEFLKNQIDFYQIPIVIEKVLSLITNTGNADKIDDYENMDHWARETASQVVQSTIR